MKFSPSSTFRADYTKIFEYMTCSAKSKRDEIIVSDS
jgi:hypothetical protein